MKELFNHEYKGFPCPIDPHYTRLDSVDVEKDGQIIRVSQFKESCFDDNYKQFVMQDFSIGNIMSVGANHLLNPVSMVNTDVSGVADAFDKLNSQLEQDGRAE